MLNKEIWSPIPSSSGKYWASSLGRIMSYAVTKKGRVLRENIRTSGYRSVMLRIDGRSIRRDIHRLVMEAFKGPSPLYVNHLDADKSNNCLNNLEYCSGSENNLHHHRLVSNKRGIRPTKYGFSARITVRSKETYLGNFRSEDEAFAAYSRKYLELYGVAPCSHYERL